jgi:hypothetical protein
MKISVMIVLKGTVHEDKLQFRGQVRKRLPSYVNMPTTIVSCSFRQIKRA